MKIILLGCLVFLLAGLFLTSADKVHAAGASLPPWPIIYTGDVSIGGEPAADGLILVGKMDDYVSIPLEIKGGRMVGLTVGPPSALWFQKEITFELRMGDLSVIAEETDVFTNLASPTLKKDFHLNFPGFPTPTPLPTATATATPVPTSTPIATATPIVVGPIVYNGMVVVSGGAIPKAASLTARVGAYESNPVPLNNGEFISLIVDLNDPGLTDAIVRFYLNGVEARTTAVYHVGPIIRNIDLIFTDFEPAPIEIAKPEPIATATAFKVEAQPAATEVPTATATVIPSPTSVPPAAPLVPPTPETVVLVVTATPAEITPVVEESNGGGCNSVSDVDPLTGTANVLAMLGPLLLLVGYRGARKLF